MMYIEGWRDWISFTRMVSCAFVTARLIRWTPFESFARAERDGQLDPQSLAAQSVGVLIGRPSLIAGKLPLAFGGGRKSNHVPRLRFTRAEAEEKAIRLATKFVAGLSGYESDRCAGAVPASSDMQSTSSKHPVVWVVMFRTPQPLGIVMDGGELFVTVNLETNAVSIRD
jgi:hypothetical protein